MSQTKHDYGAWLYNVLDRFKGKEVAEIKASLKTTASPVAVLMTQLQGDFNFGSVIRSSNNFNVSAVYYYGNKHFDKRSACGTFNYTDVIHLANLDQLMELKSQYRFVALDNNISRSVQPINEYKWETKSLIIIGEESIGIAPYILDICDDFVEIPSLGSVRSLNAAVAGSIALYDYFSKIKAA